MPHMCLEQYVQTIHEIQFPEECEMFILQSFNFLFEVGLLYSQIIKEKRFLLIQEDFCFITSITC